ncbi:MAG: class D sortase [Terriglobales bacterium]
MRAWSSRWLGTILLLAGIALILASLGQYGYMWVRQHQLRQRWQHINTPVQAAGQVRAASADSPLRLLIPSIHLDDVVVRGTSYEDLLVAPGLLEGSPLPGGGNTVIAGHRDTFFRHVSDLGPGDAIEVRSGGQEFDFVVTGQAIVQADQVSVLANTAAPRLTLVTCYPTYWIGPAPKRLIVEAELAASGPVAIHR